MIKRISFVWKRPELSDAEFRHIWLGEHVDYAKQLPGVLEYRIDFVTDAPNGAPSAIATLCFESRESLDAAFTDPHLKEHLLRTRQQFAEDVQVMIAEEHLVIRRVSGELR
jgi:uncharacterized protein (TIGR02118 family)